MLFHELNRSLEKIPCRYYIKKRRWEKTAVHVTAVKSYSYYVILQFCAYVSDEHMSSYMHRGLVYYQTSQFQLQCDTFRQLV